MQEYVPSFLGYWFFKFQFQLVSVCFEWSISKMFVMKQLSFLALDTRKWDHIVAERTHIQYYLPEFLQAKPVWIFILIFNGSYWSFQQKKLLWNLLAQFLVKFSSIILRQQMLLVRQKCEISALWKMLINMNPMQV